MAADPEPAVLIILGALNIPIFVLIGRLFFDGWDGFWAAVKFWITPDLWSLTRGQFWDDARGELYLGAFIALCGCLVFGEIWLVSRFL